VDREIETMKFTAASLALTIAVGLGATTSAAEAGDRHGQWGGKSYGVHKYERDHRGERHYRHGKRHGVHRSHRYGARKGVYRGKSRHHWKRDRYRGHRGHGYSHYRPYGDLYTRRHHSYRSGIGLNIDGVTFIWSERHYR